MKYLHTQCSRRFLPFFILLFSIGFANPAHAYDPPCPVPCFSITPTATISMSWNYALTATNSYGKTATIYDDYDFIQYLPYPYTDPILWNCGRQMLICGYTSPDDSMTLSVNLNTSTPTSYDIYVYKDTTFGDLISTYTDVAAGANFTFSNATQGLYEVHVYGHGADTSIPNSYLLNGYIIMIQKIRKVWIEAAPICSGVYPSGTFYHFQVKTDPPLSTIMDQPTDLGLSAHYTTYFPDMTTPPNCEPIFNPYNIQFQFNATDMCGYYMNVYNLPSTLGASNQFYFNNTYGTDTIDYYIEYDDINYDMAGGSCYGSQPVIQLTYTDKIADSFVANAPVIINYPAIPASSYVAVDTLYPLIDYGFPGPPNAIGVPWPSYDIYKYVVSGTEVWTPTNNPITQMRGGGGVDSVIRIQDSLIIPAGAELGLEGMTIQMGPKAGIMVGNAAGGGTGGYLDLYYSRVTAYRGCAGTDTSTWGGLTIAGDTSISEAGTYWPNPNARLVWTASSISYADVGWANGTGGASAGGEIESFGNDTFYNNRLDVQFWPYRNMESGVEGEADDIFSYDAFVYDANAWFPKNYFVNIIGAWPAEFYSCNFANNSGNTVYAGINGLEAGLYIAGCTFTNFTHAVYASYITGTHTALIGGIFTNNNFGVWINGGIANTITGSTFNIPPYSGTTPYGYAGTTVLVDSDQNIGVLVNGSAGYNISNNLFQNTDPLLPTYVTGTLQYNTGSDNNQVTSNTFSNVGVALLSNFVNNSHTSGLQYLCNKDSLTGCEISVLGAGSGIGGINPVQATSSSGGHYDLPAGNKSGLFIVNYQDSITYKWYGADPLESIVYATPSVYTVSVASPAQCYAVSGSGPFTLTEYAGERYAGTDVALNYAVAAANVNYYMMDLGGTHRRDSIYYWAGQMGTAYGDLLITNLLIEDNYIDSANTIYNNIITRYSLDSIEANEFTQGRNLENIIVSHHINGTTLFSLSEGEVATLQSVKANTTMWAHARAENWLFSFDGEPLTDTLLYPNPTDTAGRRSYHPVQPTVIGAKSNNAIYPNPVHDVLQVMYTALQADETITLEITDVSGKTVITQTLQSGVQVGINVSSLVPGTYLYRISENTKVTMSGKITKD